MSDFTNISESDLAYERAGEDEEVCEKLLADLQKKRADCLKGIARILAVIMILALLAFLLLLYPVFTPKLPHPVLDWVFAHFHVISFGVCLLPVLIGGCLLPAIHYDHRIKMLLFLRGKRKAST